MLFGLILFRISERIESSVGPRRWRQGRRRIPLFPDHPHFVGFQECARLPRNASFPVSWDSYRRKQDHHCTNVGSILRSDHLCVCRVSAMMFTLSLTSMFCDHNMSSDNTSAGLSVSPFDNGTYEKKAFGSFSANLFFNLVTESSVKCSPFFPGSNILEKLSNCHHTRFSRWGHHVHAFSAVRDGVSQ